MTEDFLKRAKEKAEELREKMSPSVQKALDETQEQAENAMTELGGILRRAAKAVRDDIAKRR